MPTKDDVTDPYPALGTEVKNSAWFAAWSPKDRATYNKMAQEIINDMDRSLLKWVEIVTVPNRKGRS